MVRAPRKITAIIHSRRIRPFQQDPCRLITDSVIFLGALRPPGAHRPLIGASAAADQSRTSRVLAQDIRARCWWDAPLVPPGRGVLHHGLAGRNSALSAGGRIPWA